MPTLIELDSQIPMIDVTKDGKTQGYASVNFRERWNELRGRVQRGAFVIGNPIPLADQHASILAAPLSTTALAAGLYEVSWYARVTVPDGVSSSLLVTIGWTESAQPLTVAGAAITGDAVTSVQTGIAPLLAVDQGSVVTYATTYASNTPNKMRYRLSLVLARVT